MEKKEAPSIERGITKINVPYFDTGLAFAYPYEGPGKYDEIMQKILNNKSVRLIIPSGEETAFLLHAAYCGREEFRKEPEIVQLREEIMKQRFLWLAGINVWVPEKYNSAHGVFCLDDEKGFGLNQEPDIGALEKAIIGGKRLDNGVRFSEDEKIRFAPRNTYREGEFSPEEFALDGFVIVKLRLEGAKRLAEASKQSYFNTNKPNSWILEQTEKPAITLSAINNYFGDRLTLSSRDFNDYAGGCAYALAA